MTTFTQGNFIFDNEEEFESYCEKEFKKIGYTVYRQVIPDEHIGREFPFQVDMIIEKDGERIGIELKYVNSLRQGSVLAEALFQVNKYQKLTYYENKITRWCIGFYFPPTGCSDENTDIFIRTFCNKLKTGFFSVNNITQHITLYKDTKSSISTSNYNAKKYEGENYEGKMER